MLLQQPPESPYDWRFNFLGFPVRVAWTFWIGALIFGFGMVQVADRYITDGSINIGVLYLMWAACMLVSILIHELGHALAFRQFGIESSVVLYHFGGFAVPRESYGMGLSHTQLSSRQELWIAAAGPVAQLVSAIVIIAGLMVGGFEVWAFNTSLLAPLRHLFPEAMNPSLGKSLNGPLTALVTFYLWPSIIWALLNLLPVWPLDGGRITRSIMQIFGRPTIESLWVSVVCAGLIALYGFRSGSIFLGILFLSLAISNYQAIQQNSGWRY